MSFLINASIILSKQKGKKGQNEETMWKLIQNIHISVKHIHLNTFQLKRDSDIYIYVICSSFLFHIATKIAVCICMHDSVIIERRMWAS